MWILAAGHRRAGSVILTGQRVRAGIAARAGAFAANAVNAVPVRTRDICLTALTIRELRGARPSSARPTFRIGGRSRVGCQPSAAQCRRASCVNGFPAIARSPARNATTSTSAACVAGTSSERGIEVVVGRRTVSHPKQCGKEGQTTQFETDSPGKHAPQTVYPGGSGVNQELARSAYFSLERDFCRWRYRVSTPCQNMCIRSGNRVVTECVALSQARAHGRAKTEADARGARGMGEASRAVA
jgi:hypothetical protein